MVRRLSHRRRRRHPHRQLSSQTRQRALPQTTAHLPFCRYHQRNSLQLSRRQVSTRPCDRLGRAGVISRRDLPEPCCRRAPRHLRGAGRAGPRLRPVARLRKKMQAAGTTGPAGRSGPPCAIGFNGVLRALLGDRALLPPSPVLLLRADEHELDLSIGRPGPHDFAVRDASARLAQHPRPSQPTSTYRDDAYALCMRRDGRSEA